MDPSRAVSFGKFIVAAYDMFAAGGDEPLRPPPSPSFPSGYELHAWVTMSDFLLTLAVTMPRAASAHALNTYLHVLRRDIPLDRKCAV
jgi:hypothetical protein